WAVDLHDVFFPERLEDALGHDCAGGRQIDEAAHARAFDYAVSSGCDLEHDLRRRQARHHGFDRVGHLAGGAGRLRSHRDEALERLPPGVQYEEAVARPHPPTRPGEAPFAEAPEA